MTIAEKLAYIKGLRDGMELDTSKPEGRLIDAIIDLLDGVSTAIADLDDQALAVSDELDEMEESIDLLESAVYEDDTDVYEKIEGDDDEDESDEDEDDEEEPDDEADEDDEAVYDFGDEAIYELSCPACGEEITIDEETLEKGSIRCPKCGEELEFDLDGEDEEISEE